MFLSKFIPISFARAMISSICSKESNFITHWKGVFCQNKIFEIQIHSDVLAVPDAFWELTGSLKLENDRFLQKSYLLAMSAFCDTWMVLFTRSGVPVGYAVFFLSTFQSNELEHELSQCIGIRDWLARKWTTSKKEQHVLVCGNPLISGEHAFVFAEDISTIDQANFLCDAMNAVVKEVRAKGIPLSICMMKDFYPVHETLQENLKNCGFSKMAGDPVMILPILEEWQTLGDYQNDLISKFRSKSLTALEKSKDLVKRVLSAEEMSNHSEDWYPLYEQVYERAQYQWKKLSAQAIIDMKLALGEDFVMQGYYFENKMIGFSISILGDQEMEAHLVGIDYEKNKQFQLYSRMLYDFVQLGIEQKKSWICFGRTALEIKSSIGALALPGQALLRHSKPITNVLVRWIISKFQSEEVSLRSVWKQEAYERLNSKLEKR